jgi:hypothetical protein
MFDFTFTHENGVAMRPRLVTRREFFELIRFFPTLKYGLSVSPEAAAVVRRRRLPAGVSQSLALSGLRPEQQADERAVVALVRLVVVGQGVLHRQVGAQPAVHLRLRGAGEVDARVVELGTTPSCLSADIATR